MYLCFTMKRKVGEQKVIQLQLPELSNEFEMQGQPEVILGRQWNPTVGKEEVLVKWTNQSEIEAMWVEMSSFNLQFPDFHLEGKVFCKGGYC